MIETSDTFENRLFGKPNVTPLGLDLKELTGGGYAPAQFNGKTHDGKWVYCRYRGGTLSVEIECDPEEAIREGATEDTEHYRCWEEGALYTRSILKASIGTPYHGGLQIGQLCEIAGITINGTRPPLPDDYGFDTEFIDFSGRTTQYCATLESTDFTSRYVLDHIRQTLPNCRLVVSKAIFVAHKHTHNEVAILDAADALDNPFAKLVVGTDTTLPVGDRPAAERVEKTVPASGLVIDIIGRWGNSFRSTTAATVKTPMAAALGWTPEVPPEIYRRTSLTLRTLFTSEDQKKREWCKTINTIIDECFPVVQMERVDLATNAATPWGDAGNSIDQTLLKWCSDDENRFLFTSPGRQDDASKFFGWRPAR